MVFGTKTMQGTFSHHGSPPSKLKPEDHMADAVVAKAVSTQPSKHDEDYEKDMGFEVSREDIESMNVDSCSAPSRFGSGFERYQRSMAAVAAECRDEEPPDFYSDSDDEYESDEMDSVVYGPSSVSFDETKNRIYNVPSREEIARIYNEERLREKRKRRVAARLGKREQRAREAEEIIRTISSKGREEQEEKARKEEDEVTNKVEEIQQAEEARELQARTQRCKQVAEMAAQQAKQREHEKETSQGTTETETPEKAPATHSADKALADTAVHLRSTEQSDESADESCNNASSLEAQDDIKYEEDTTGVMEVPKDTEEGEHKVEAIGKGEASKEKVLEYEPKENKELHVEKEMPKEDTAGDKRRATEPEGAPYEVIAEERKESVEAQKPVKEIVEELNNETDPLEQVVAKTRTQEVSAEDIEKTQDVALEKGMTSPEQLGNSEHDSEESSSTPFGGKMSIVRDSTREVIMQARRLQRRKKKADKAKKRKEEEDRRRAEQETQQMEEYMQAKRREAQEIRELAHSDTDEDDLASTGLFSLDSVAISFFDSGIEGVYSSATLEMQHAVEKTSRASPLKTAALKGNAASTVASAAAVASSVPIKNKSMKPKGQESALSPNTRRSVGADNTNTNKKIVKKEKRGFGKFLKKVFPCL